MIGEDHDSQRTLTRRAFFLAAGQGLLLAVLGGRLAYLQLIEGDKYKTLSEKNRINMKLTAPSRGEVVDRFGVPLAVNKDNFRLLIVPEQTDDLEQSIEQLRTFIDIPDRVKDRVLKQVKQQASFVPIEIIDELDWETVSKLEVNISELPGMSIELGELRSYPFSEATAHLVGYVGRVNQDSMTDDPVLRLPGFQIGKTAIEKSYDHILRGEAGTIQSEVNVRGREVRELKHIKAQKGQRITLTIDAEFQRFCQETLATQRSASAVVMDCKTGAVYALASYPSFDPNLFAQGISAGDWLELLDNPAFPMNNKAVTGQYPPASTFKMVTTLAGLEKGLITPKTTSYCRGSYELGKDRFHCWKLSGHGYVNAITALMKSCDIFYYELATQIGIDELAIMAQRFGLGQIYDFDIEEERKGLVPTKDWKMKTQGTQWQPGETVVASIGQGYILATPLQLAVMTSRLVNGGIAVKPFLVSHLDDKEIYQKSWSPMNVPKEHLEMVMRGMEGVVNHKEGTAYGLRLDDPAYAYGGKTGTAQVKRINRAQRAMGIMNEDLDWKFRHHALFVGYAPLINPRYVCSVVVEHGGGGSAVAAPLARDILFEAQKRNLSEIKISG